MDIEARQAHFNKPVNNLRIGMIVMTLSEIGIFTELVTGPASLTALASRVSAVPSRLRAYLDLAVHHNFLERDQENYKLIEGDEILFDPSNQQTHSMTLRPLRQTFNDLGRGLEILRGGDHIEVAGSGSTKVDQESRERFLESIHNDSIIVAEQIADLFPSNTKRIIDLGCGAGTYSFALLERCPMAHALLVDRDNAWPFISRLAQQKGLQDRITFTPKDLLTESLGEGFDLAILSNVIHIYSPDDNRILLQNIAQSLVLGGRIAIKDYCMRSDRSGPDWVLDFALQMALLTKGGAVYNAHEVEKWCKELGLKHDVTHDRSQEGYYLIIVQKTQ
jgi:SAM-dependent methyltransferase